MPYGADTFVSLCLFLYRGVGLGFTGDVVRVSGVYRPIVVFFSGQLALDGHLAV